MTHKDHLPFVSIVVISRDRHELLEQTVDSLLALDYPSANYEIVIVEEGDGAKPIEGVHYVFLPRRNLGLGYARNTGVQNAQGEIIAFTDDDCLHEKNWLTLKQRRGGGGSNVRTAGQPYRQV